MCVCVFEVTQLGLAMQETERKLSTINAFERAEGENEGEFC